MLVLHVSSPVILPREGFASLSRVGAGILRAEVLLCFGVFVVDMSVEMGLRAEPLAAAGMFTEVWAIVVAGVMAGVC